MQDGSAYNVDYSVRRRKGKERPYRKDLKPQLDRSDLDKSRWSKNSFWLYGIFLDVLDIEDHHLKSHFLWKQDWSATQNLVRLSIMVLNKLEKVLVITFSPRKVEGFFMTNLSFFLSLVTKEEKMPRLLPLCISVLFDSANKWSINWLDYQVLKHLSLSLPFTAISLKWSRQVVWGC